jgi:hypothetical protein
VLLLTACGPVGDGDDSGTSGSGGAVRDGGTMTVALADDPDMLDPTLARTLVGRMVFMSMCEKLYEIDEKLQARTIEEWEKFFNDAGIPAGPVYAMDSALDHPQVRHREMVVSRPHPVLGEVSLLGLPVKFSETPGDVHRIPPELGEHTDAILKELESSDEISLETRRSLSVQAFQHTAGYDAAISFAVFVPSRNELNILGLRPPTFASSGVWP